MLLPTAYCLQCPASPTLSPTAYDQRLAALLTAFDYAADSGLDRWEFAVEMSELLAAGAKLADLRWLIRRSLAEHAKETTVPGDPARTFRPLAPTSFPDDACLTLTLLGAAKLRPFVQQTRQESVTSRPENAKFAPSLATGSEDLESGTQQPDAPLAGSLASRSANRSPDHATSMAQNGDPATTQRVVNDAANASPAPSPDSPFDKLRASSSPSAGRPKPRWYPELHELHFNSSVIKRFKLPARNQELILAAFEEEGWPSRIDDPLPPTGDLDPRQRLRNTIVTLNRHQLTPLLHFRCDGTGCGIQWEQRRTAITDSPLP